MNFMWHMTFLCVANYILYYYYQHLPIQDAWLSSILMKELACFSCGIATALKPNTKPVSTKHQIKKQSWKLQNCNGFIRWESKKNANHISEPVLIVPRFATNAATTWRKALPRSCLLLYGLPGVIGTMAGAGGLSFCICCADFTITGIGAPLSIINVCVSLTKKKLYTQ